jgi:hypothetical protein
MKTKHYHHHNYQKWILFFITCCFIYYLYTTISLSSSVLKCIVIDESGKKYCVRNRTKVHEAAHLLSQVTDNMNRMVEYMKINHPNDKRTKRLVNGFNANVITETLPTSTLTAYSENKGQKIAMCLNKNKLKGEDELIDINTLTFVALHELSHIMTISIGHKEEFWQNFKFLLENAQKANIYFPQDYKKQSQSYCGMTLNDNPHFDYH